MKNKTIICGIMAILWLILYAIDSNQSNLILSGVWFVGALIISGQNES